MDLDAEFAAVRARARRRADQLIQDMQRDLRRAGAEDRRIIRQAAGLPEPVNLFDAAVRAVRQFAGAMLGFSSLAR